MDNNLSQQALARRHNDAMISTPAPPDRDFPDSTYGAPTRAETPDLLDYFRILLNRRWTILSILLAVSMITAIATWKATPMYRATAKLQIDPEQGNLLPFKDAIEPGMNYAQSQEYLQTQFKVLESESLARRVIRALNLSASRSFMADAAPHSQGRILHWAKSLFGLDEESTLDRAADSANDREMDSLVRVFRERMATSPIRSSRLVDVSFESRDPGLAAAIANTITNEYIQMNFETKFNATNTASNFLSEQLVELKAKVEKSENELVQFSRQHDIYMLADNENVVLQKLADLNSALTKAQAERIQKESVWSLVRQNAVSSFPEILRTNRINDLEANLARLRVQHAKLSSQFKPGWPELDQVAGQLAEAENQLATARREATRNAEIEYGTAVQREKLLSEALGTQKIQASAFSQDSIHYNILKRQVDTDKQLYDGLLQRLKEAGVSAGLKSSNIHIVDQARPPRLPFRPDKPMNMLLALCGGLMLGTVLSFLLEYFDDSIKTPEDVERQLRLFSLGIIPSASTMLLPPGRRLLAVPAWNRDKSGQTASQQMDLISHRQAQSVAAEAYRNLRTSLMLSSVAEHAPHTLLITSSHVGEGKTTTALNVSITLAQTGASVVLLDCDLRNPRLHRALGLRNEAGISNFLGGDAELAPLLQGTQVSNLFCMPSGTIPSNPAELLGSQKMRECLSLLAEKFDYVVIDSPPVMPVTDARILATITDGVILVVKGGETPKRAVKAAKRLLSGVNARIIGTLLNNVNLRSAEYSYYARQYYGYGLKSSASS